jgi:3-vinyl bacteriochlorophyllide hydratase
MLHDRAPVRSIAPATSDRAHPLLSRSAYSRRTPIDGFVDAAEADPAVRFAQPRALGRRPARRPLYSAAERRRRDASPWTLVQGILAPIQFAIFLVSLGLVVRYLVTGDGLLAASISIVIKTLVLYTIMITGSIWEHRVFGRYLFAPSFFWEDVVSMLVLALHTAYLGALAAGVDTRFQMILALAAYASYAVNATQFVVKLRAARRESRAATDAVMGVSP